LEQRCRTSQEETETFKQRQKIRPAIRQRQTPSSGQGTRSAPSLPFPSSSHDMGRPLSPSILEILLKPIPGQDDAAPYELTHDMKKKKKRKPRL
jgi:predicted transcriptional regulator